jgi:hypothetical protein
MRKSLKLVKKPEGVTARAARATGKALAKGLFEYGKTRMTGGTEPHAVVSGVLAAIQSGFEDAILAHVDDQKDAWFANFAAAWHERTPLFEGVFEEQLKEKLEDPANRKTLHESWVKARESLDQAVYPALARLSVEYVGAGKKPDALFRGVGRVLADLDANEFVTFRTLLAEGAEYVKDSPKLILDSTPKGVGFRHPHANPTFEETKMLEGINQAHAHRLILLLNSNYVGEQVSLWGGNDSRSLHINQDRLLWLNGIANG